ncbi:DUF1823 family protein [Synechococcus sp. PCC 7336]|uniref:DUF1823 family protein n=1 Tax=Synechococcus sp. PCC 7336 TaxID=195250 RepID=UPI00034DA9A9|nr:DUF1823 family protein [Synechococcus sp. PCC 7336]
MELPNLSVDTIWAILNGDLEDEVVNALVWRSLNYSYDPDTDRWDASTAEPPWHEVEAPNFIGSRPDTIALTRSIPKEYKQLLKERLDFQGYQVHELTPQKTRRATAANWLLFRLTAQISPSGKDDSD